MGYHLVEKSHETLLVGAVEGHGVIMCGIDLIIIILREDLNWLLGENVYGLL